jgi:hypothetical protein
MEFRVYSNRQLTSSYWPLGALAAAVAAALTLVTCGKTTITGQVNNGMATVNVSISDPPSCLPPAGNFKSVFITIRSVQAHISATADDNSPGWVELAPELNAEPVQVDLLNLPANGACMLKTLGSNTSLPAGDYQQIRLLLVPDNPERTAPLQPLLAFPRRDVTASEVSAFVMSSLIRFFSLVAPSMISAASLSRSSLRR